VVDTALQPVSGIVELFHHDPGRERQKILELEARMFAAVGEGIARELPVRHVFIKGGYAREMTIPAGCLIVGHIHRDESFAFVTRGHITVLTEEGVKDIVGPTTIFTAPAGVKRVGYAHTETVWTTIHVTDETNFERMIEVLTVPSYEEYDALFAPKLELK
jgi:quercetin dioxygenase-like cupin family protein